MKSKMGVFSLDKSLPTLVDLFLNNLIKFDDQDYTSVKEEKHFLVKTSVTQKYIQLNIHE